jgi:hypothetical protein
MEMVFQASNNLRSGRPRGKLEGVWRSAFGVRRSASPAVVDEHGGLGVEVARERETYQGDHESIAGRVRAPARPGPWPATPIPQPSLSLRSKAHPFAPG